MRQALLNIGVLQLAMTSLSALTAHSAHQQKFQFTRLSIWTLEKR